METTFYHDEGRNNMMQKMKSKMTLDFGSSAKTKQSKFTNLLSSPDLNLLKLASPELEKMIIQHNGLVTTTPTPTQFLCPKYVTEEQEAYARGFVDALAELHKKQGPPSANVVTEIGGSTVLEPSTNVTSQTTTLANLTTVTSIPSDVSSTSATQLSIPSIGLTSMGNLSAPQISQASSIAASSRAPGATASGSGVLRIKQESSDMDTQCVPCIGNTPPLSPINMENQERIKLERKRARNRVAARKCRTRKLERISRLEDRVSDLKDVNLDLSDRANQLRDEVCRLKQQIMDHVQSGCPVMLSQNLTL